MSSLFDIFNNDTLKCTLIAWFVAQALKILFLYIIKGEFKLDRFWGSGGMPSSHTAVVVALSNMVGAQQGYSSDMFALTFILSAIVMYDATGVRQQTGKQTTVINQIIKKVFINGDSITDNDLKELVGHTPIEVLGGFILGLVVSAVYLAIMK